MVGVSRKAEMGVGMLIIFIALLLVAAVAAGVLITTSGALQEKALATGKQATSQISTHINVVEVSASDGTTSESLDYFQEVIKLAPGSDKIDLDDLTIVVSTDEKTATIEYGGATANFTLGPGGYFTMLAETFTLDPGETGVNNQMINIEADYDFDGNNDQFWSLGQGFDLAINFSATDPVGPPSTVSMGLCAGGIHFPNAAIATQSNGLIASAVLTCTADDNVSSAYIVPGPLGGNFSSEYLQKSPNYMAGFLQKGDVVRLYIQAPESIGEDESMRINLIPKIGKPTLTLVSTPDVISAYQVFLYP